jgi:hypothetical protein
MKIAVAGSKRNMERRTLLSLFTGTVIRRSPPPEATVPMSFSEKGVRPEILTFEDAE